MRPSLLPLLAILLAALAAAGCTRCESRREMEFYVEGVPHTLADAKDLDDPPDVEVTVAKGSRQGGGGAACGHSPACVILLPFIVGDAMFPSHFKVVTVKEQGKVRFSGVYKQNGELMRGVVTKDGMAHKIDVLTLRALGRVVVVEVEHAPLGPDGKPGKYRPSSVQKQVDLLGAYRQALSDEPKQHVDLLVEALSVLDHEAVPLVKERFASPAEPSEVKRDVVRRMCGTAALPNAHPLPSKPEDRKTLLEALLSGKPDPETAVHGLVCLRDEASSALAGKLMARVVPAVCSGTGNAKVARQLFQWVTQSGARRLPKPGESQRADAARQRLLAHSEGCTHPELSQLLRFWLRAPLSHEELVSLVADPKVVAQSELVRDLDPDDADDRQVLIEVLQRQPKELLLARLLKAAEPPDAAERQVLLDVYVAPGDERRPRLRALALHRLGASSERDAIRSGMKQRFAEAPAERGAWLAARVALGDPKAQPELFGLAVASRCPGVGDAGAASDGDAAPAPSALPAASASAGSASGREPRASGAPASPSAAPSASGRSAAPAPASPRYPSLAACMRYYTLRSSPHMVFQPEQLWAYALGAAGCQREDLVKAAERLDAGAEPKPPICRARPEQ